MSFLRRLSLSNRLTAVALLALIPLSALVLYLDLSQREVRRDAGIREARVFAQEIATSLQAFSREIGSFTAAAGIALGSEPDLTADSVQEYLANLADRYPQVRAVFLTSPEGMFVNGSDKTTTVSDLSNRPYVTALQEGAEAIWAPGVAGLETGLVTATFSRVVRGVEGEPRGFLVVAFHPSNLDQALEGRLAPDGNLVLLDGFGQVVYSSLHPEKALQNYADDPLVSASYGGQFVDIEDRPTPFDEGDRYGVIVAVEQMNWLVAYTRSSAQLSATLNAQLYRDFGILVAITAVVAGALYVMARQMTRPLSILAATAGEIGQGAPTAVPMQENAPPEVASLQRAFADMTVAVQDREQRLREQAERLASLEQAGAAIAGNLEYKAAVQAIVDAGRTLTQAQFAAFLSRDYSGEAHQPEGLSGIDEESFQMLPPELMTVGLTRLRPDRVVRLDDLAATNGAFPKVSDEVVSTLRSYMAVPVVARQDVVGSLVFGHSQPSSFSQRHEDVALGVASWAAIALDNAHLYEESRRIQAELAEANRAKDEFLGIISHELRTPVTTIYGGLRLLASHRVLLESEQGQDFIETMAGEGARLVRLIEDLLALTRVELGKELDTQPSDVNLLVSEVLDGFRYQNPGRPVDFVPGEDLPRIEVEPAYFRQVMTNLLSNAEKYSPSGLPVTVTTFRVADDVRVVVADSGPGVDAEEIGRIFESFYRSEKTAASAPGQGLGLTVCRKLVEAQQGSIWAENRATGGLAVSVSFRALPVGPEEGMEVRSERV